MSDTSNQLRPIQYIDSLDCPACGHSTLYVGAGNYITCGLEECPNPDFAEALEQNIASRIAEARQDEVHRFLTRSDSLGESKYATRRLNELRNGGKDV